jgi:hypothetical protein
MELAQNAVIIANWLLVIKLVLIESMVAMFTTLMEHAPYAGVIWC